VEGGNTTTRVREPPGCSMFDEMRGGGERKGVASVAAAAADSTTSRRPVTHRPVQAGS